jgi:hypothetical protein
VQTVHDQWEIGERVADDDVNLGALGDPEERTWHLQRFSLFRECAYLDADVRLGVGMPLTRAHLEANGEDTVAQRASRHPVVVRDHAVDDRCRR